MKKNPWLRGWRGLVLGLVAGVITAMLVAYTADKASARVEQPTAYECPGDLQGCTSPREHARKFRRGKYGGHRARRRLPYPRVARIKYVRAVRRWNRRHSGYHRPRYSWRELQRADTCTSNGYPANMWTECSLRNFPREPRKWRNGRVSVAQCAGVMLPALATGGATFWVGWGAGMCLWQEMD